MNGWDGMCINSENKSRNKNVVVPVLFLVSDVLRAVKK
jgi:hypothetical protein